MADCRGVAREDIQSPGAVVIENRILLPRFAMKRRASFKLLVLLSGTGGGVHGKGYSFWTVEYLYTYGPPAGFLSYLNSGPSRDILRRASYSPVLPTTRSPSPGPGAPR